MPLPLPEPIPPPEPLPNPEPRPAALRGQRDLRRLRDADVRHIRVIRQLDLLRHQHRRLHGQLRMIELQNLRRRQRLLLHLRQLALRGLDGFMIAATTAAAHDVLRGRSGNKRRHVDGRDRAASSDRSLVPLLQREEQDQPNDHRVGDERNRARGRVPLHRHRVFHRDRRRAQLQRRQLLREEHVDDAGEQRLPDRLFDDRIEARKVQSRRFRFPTPICVRYQVRRRQNRIPHVSLTGRRRPASPDYE